MKLAPNTYFSCDFETSSERFFAKHGRVEVWAASAMDIYNLKTVKTTNNINSFMEWALSFDRLQNHKYLFFHNLKFDGNFILSWLYVNKYRHCDKSERRNNRFSSLITDMGVWYCIEIYVKHQGKLKTVTIYDSLKKLPYSADSVAKAFDVGVMKTSIDYNALRSAYSDLMPLDKAYVENDTLIIATALKYQLENGYSSMTVASDALKYYKTTINKTAFKNYFPELNYDCDSFLRQAYRGGYVSLKPDKANIMQYGVYSFDSNSMYPDKMLNRFLPVGAPRYFEGRYKYNKNFPLYVQMIECSFVIKDNHVPTIQIKKSSRFADAEYATSSNGAIVCLVLTSVDLELFFTQYHVYEPKYISGYCFKQSNRIFKKYVEHFYDIKLKAKGAMRSQAKLMLNGLYGKFAKAMLYSRNIPHYDKIKRCVYFTKSMPEIEKGLYLPVALFITAYARHELITLINANYGIFIYCDTDSIHTTSPDIKGLKQDNDKIGFWKNEGRCERALFIRAKTYMKEYKDDKGNLYTKVTCAGMPDKVKKYVTFENFKRGTSYNGKLVNKRVVGGSLLYETEFSIK